MPFNDETYFFNQALKKYIKIDIDLSSKMFISVHPYYLFMMDLRSLLFTSENSININCELKCEIINIT